VQAVAELVIEAETQAQIQANHVGIGAPGSPSPETGIQRNSNSIALNGQSLAADLAEAIGRPVRLANDANCLALSEAWNGAGAGKGTVFAVILGTGVGGGLVIDDALLEGCNGVGGEFGHTALPRPTANEAPGPPCYCGLNGCIEAWLAGPALEAEWTTLGHDPLPATAIAVNEHNDAHALIDAWLNRLARALANAINLVDPDVIVIGGGLNAIDAIYTKIPAMLGPLVFGGSCTTPLVRATHGDSSGVLGAARL
jgi:fructokinase